MTTHPNAQEDKRRAALEAFNRIYEDAWKYQDLNDLDFSELGDDAAIVISALAPAVEPVVDGGMWLPDGHMPLPKTEREAEMMVLIGQTFLDDYKAAKKTTPHKGG